jgi:hypothetical protein
MNNVSNILINTFKFNDIGKEEVKLIEITPSIANVFLANSIGNRLIKQSRVIAYKQQILNGNFSITFDAIGFDKELKLCNGHHRLRAVIDANKSISAMVGINGDHESFKHTDIGATRTASDQLRMFSSANTECTVSNIAVGVANFIIKTNYNKNGSRDIDFVESIILKNDKGLKFVEDVYNTKKKGLCSIGIKSAIVAAHNTVNKDKLTSFCMMLKEGIIEQDTSVSESNSALLLRQIITDLSYLKQVNKLKLTHSTEITALLYDLTEVAIKHFDSGKKISKLQTRITRDDQAKLVIPTQIYSFNRV